MQFGDRREAGKILGKALARWGLDHPAVVAVASGGVPVAEEIADHLLAPLEAISVRKISVPDRPQVSLWAVADGDPPEAVVNPDLARAFGLGEKELEHCLSEALEEVRRADAKHRRGLRPIPLKGRCAILVDDGIVSGMSMHAAIRSLRRREIAELIVATPVAPPEVVERLRGVADSVLCLRAPLRFGSIASQYRDFSPVTGVQVARALRAAWRGKRRRSFAFA